MDSLVKTFGMSEAGDTEMEGTDAMPCLDIYYHILRFLQGDPQMQGRRCGAGLCPSNSIAFV